MHLFQSSALDSLSSEHKITSSGTGNELNPFLLSCFWICSGRSEVEDVHFFLESVWCCSESANMQATKK